MRAWERGALPLNKMADWSRLSGYTPICAAHGTESWVSEDDEAAGVLQLWYNERENDYRIYVSNTEADYGMVVCNVIDVFTLHFQKCTDKIKTLLIKEVEISFPPILKTNSTM